MKHEDLFESKPSAKDYFSWYCKDYLEQYLDRKGINLSEEEIKSMSENLADNLLNSSHIWDEIDTEIEDNIAIDFVEQYKNKFTNIEYLRYNKGFYLFLNNVAESYKHKSHIARHYWEPRDK